MLGEQYMYKHKVNSGANKGKLMPLYIDMTTPTKFGKAAPALPPSAAAPAGALEEQVDGGAAAGGAGEAAVQDSGEDSGEGSAAAEGETQQ